MASIILIIIDKKQSKRENDQTKKKQIKRRATPEDMGQILSGITPKLKQNSYKIHVNTPYF